MSEEFDITEKGRAVIESGLSLRHVHELETGCRDGDLCARCRRDMAASWIALGRPRIAELEANPTTDRMAEYSAWAAAVLPGILDTLEAILAHQRTTGAGWLVGQPTVEGWAFLRSYDRPEPTSAGAEHDLTAAVEQDGPGSGWALLEVRKAGR